MNPILIFFITVAVSTVFWTCFYSIIFWLLDSEWKGCFKCDCPVKTIKNNKLCKACKKEGFRFKTKKQIKFEAWENNIKETEEERGIKWLNFLKIGKI